jgi:hypothetical protein
MSGGKAIGRDPSRVSYGNQVTGRIQARAGNGDPDIGGMCKTAIQPKNVAEAEEDAEILLYEKMDEFEKQAGKCRSFLSP